MTRLSVRFFLFKNFIKFYSKATTYSRVSSPYLSGLAKNVLEDDRNFYAYPIIQHLRAELLQNNKRIEITDFGAGSKADAQSIRPIKSVARHSAIDARTGKMLFRLVNWRKPRNILELGTSLGLSTLYQASAALNAKVTTVEGCPPIARIARENFRRMGLSTINQINATFQDALTKILHKTQIIDYVFLDGDHRAGASIRYFEQILPHLGNDSLFIIADIYWSEEMQMAWHQLKQRPEITASVDFYDFGILFFRKEEKQKKHFQLVPSSWKPWKVGFNHR